MRRFALVATCSLAITLLATTAAFAQKDQAPKVQKNGPGPKSKAELEAINAMIQARDLDARIAAADALITKYSNTDFKSFALFQEAYAYEQKGDHAKAIVFCEEALAADKNNFEAEAMMANVIASQIHENDLDKAEKLAQVDKFAKESLEVIKVVPKSPLFPRTEEQWTMTKNIAASQAWQALGTAAVAQKKIAEGVDDYQKGLALDPDPTLMLRIGRAEMNDKKYDEAISWFDKAAAAPDSTEQIKKIAANDKARATANKALAK